MTAAIRQVVGPVRFISRVLKPGELYLTPAQFNSDCVLQKQQAFFE